MRDHRAMPRTVTLVLSAAILAHGAASGAAVGAADQASRQASASAALAAVKADIMTADYQADLAALESGRARALAFAGDAELAYLAHYWAGYSDWRLAMNGVSRGISQADILKHVESAAAELDQSIGRRDDFADGHAAVASVSSWLASLKAADREAMTALLVKSKTHLATALRLDPENPRVLWVQGGGFLFKPAQFGGSFDRALEIYRKGAATAATLAPGSPLPDWGKVESLMSQAYLHLHQPAPDAVAAATEAAAALALRPDWYYVRAVLLPQIQAAKADRR